MPRSRLTEMPQRTSNLRPSRLPDGRSPRGSRSEPVSQKKLGSRISDLESQLVQAQVELKSLKKTAQDQLDKKSKKQPKMVYPKIQESNTASPEVVETDVFEVPESKDEEELNMLKTELDKRDRELDALRRDNEDMKRLLHEKSLRVSSVESEIEELTLRLGEIDQELGKSRSMNEKLEAAERAKEELEKEMKRLRVQTEQWRKAADAAASIMASEIDVKGRRLFEGRYTGFEGSPGQVDESDDGFRGGKRKGGSGIRVFGDMWMKKGNK